MKRITAPQVAGLITMLSGNSANVPVGMKPVTGVLVYRDGPNLAYWNPKENEWVPVNSAGFSSRFRCNMPMLPDQSWAIITSAVLLLTGGVCHHKIGPKALLWSFHAVNAEVAMQQLRLTSAESGGQVSDLSRVTNPDQEEIAQDVTDYIAEHAQQGVTPIQ